MRERINRCLGLGRFLALSAVLAASSAALGVEALPSNGAPGAGAEDMIGQVSRYTTRYSDTLLDVARANRLGFTDIVAANPGVDPWLPGEGAQITLPTGRLLPEGARSGILINLGEHRLYYFPPGGGAPIGYPIGVGREGWVTPLGRTTIVRKLVDPIWFPPDSVRAEEPELPTAVGPGPDNPLGNRALYLGWSGYLVHGTNIPWGVGRRSSHGCIRLYPEDIVDLYERVAIGTPVEVVDQPVKLGWHQDALYIEAHPEVAQIEALEEKGRLDQASGVVSGDLYFKIIARAGALAERVDWQMVRYALLTRLGVPTQITPASLSETE
jgi:L,D-transpeptidase ErfK/SrfK